MIRFIAVFAAVLLAAGGGAIADTPKPREYPFLSAPPTLQIGDAAPEFAVGRWFKGGPVAPSQERLLIVDCWATWCHWCVAGFPHLSELAKTYQGKVDVVGLDVRETQTTEQVQEFVTKQGERMGFAVAGDGEDRFVNAWLKPAGQEGLPTAFIIQKGRIVWIGITSKIDAKLLDSILDGSFKVEEAKKAAAHDRAVNAAKMEIGWYSQTKDYDTAIRKADEAMAAYPDASAVFQPMKETSLKLKEAAK